MLCYRLWKRGGGKLYPELHQTLSKVDPLCSVFYQGDDLYASIFWNDRDPEARAAIKACGFDIIGETITGESLDEIYSRITWLQSD